MGFQSLASERRELNTKTPAAQLTGVRFVCAIVDGFSAEPGDI